MMCRLPALMLCAALALCGISVADAQKYRKYSITFDGYWMPISKGGASAKLKLENQIKAAVAGRGDAINADFKLSDITDVMAGGADGTKGFIVARVAISDRVTEAVYNSVATDCKANCKVSPVYQGPLTMAEKTMSVTKLVAEVIVPTSQPTTAPTFAPTGMPTGNPTPRPTDGPTSPTGAPTPRPTYYVGRRGVRDASLSLIIGMIFAIVLIGWVFVHFMKWVCGYKEGEHHHFLTPTPKITQSDGSDENFHKHKKILAQQSRAALATGAQAYADLKDAEAHNATMELSHPQGKHLRMKTLVPRDTTHRP